MYTRATVHASSISGPIHPNSNRRRFVVIRKKLFAVVAITVLDVPDSPLNRR